MLIKMPEQLEPILLEALHLLTKVPPVVKVPKTEQDFKGLCGMVEAWGWRRKEEQPEGVLYIHPDAPEGHPVLIQYPTQ